MLDYMFVVGTYVSIDIFLAVGMTVITGLGGMFIISIAATYGVGAYICAQLAVHAHLGTLGDLTVGMVGAGLFGICILPLIGRLRSDHLAIGSLAVQLVASDVFSGWTSGTGGSYGIFGVKAGSVFGLVVSSTGGFFFFCATLAILAMFVAHFLERSKQGLLLRAQRDDEELIRSWGHRPAMSRASSFIMASLLSGVAGGLFAFFQGYISASSFDVNISLMILTIIVVGGLGNIWGAVIVTIVLVAVPEILSLVSAGSDWVAQVQLMLDGVVVIIMVAIRPEGLIPERHRFFMSKIKGLISDKAQEFSNNDKDLAEQISEVGALLAAAKVLEEGPSTTFVRNIEVRGLQKRFGGVLAVNDVSFELRPGEVTALIGPNGAGKTTTLGLIAGALKPNTGTIRFGDQNIGKLSADAVARQGIFRTFQGGRLFPTLNVLENVVVALLGLHNRVSLLEVRRDAEHLLNQFGLGHLGNSRATDLAYGEQKLIMIAIAAGRGDEVLLFDEVAAGLDAATVKAFAPLVKRLALSGKTVCVVEHNLGFVWECADRVIVMDAGRVIVDDLPEVVQNNPLVGQIYFGGGGGVESGVSS